MDFFGDQITEIRIDEKYSNFLKSKDVNRKEGKTEPAIRQKTFLTKDFLDRVKGQSRFTSSGEILPQNCRLYKPLSNKTAILVVEDTPRIRTISVNINMEAAITRLKKTGKLIEYGFRDFLTKNTLPYRFTLSFPYVVYIATLHGIGRRVYVDSFQVYYRLSPITSLSDYLLINNLPNSDTNQFVCLGGGNSEYGSLYSSFNRALEKFWVNTFNTDYIYNYQKYENVPEICDFLNWLYNTNRDPLFVFDIPWIRNQFTLGEIINYMEEDYRDEGIRLNYNSLSTIFTRPYEPEDLQQEEGKDAVLDGICNSMFLKERELSVGEKVWVEGKEYYVYSFIGRNSGKPTFIQLEDEEGKLSKIELTEEIIYSFDEQLDKTEFLDSVKLSGGQTVKVGDVVLVDFPQKMYKKVDKIRVARDGLIEVRLLGEYYIAKNLQAKFIDLEKFEFNSVKLEKGEKYLLTSDLRGFPCSYYEEVEFKEAAPSPTGRIVLKFEYVKSKEKVSLDASRKKGDIFTQRGLSSTKVFRVGRKLFTNGNKSVLLSKRGAFFPRGQSSTSTFDCELAKREIVKDNEIEITSFDLDINFKVGEKVVVSNWNDLPQMLKVWTITGFKFSGNVLQIELQHKQEKMSVAYIDFEPSSRQVEVGLIRKVVNEFGGIKAGTKIRAKEKGIPNFPKKDVNIIIAFIVDTGGHPLVLCSNCCTLWMFDLTEKFELVPIESTLWKDLEHAPINLNRIRIQFGDMFKYASSFTSIFTHYMYTLSSYNGRESLFRIEDYSSIAASYSGLDRVTTRRTSNRYGFITPRYTEAQTLAFTIRRMLPNFHGLYTEVPESYTAFLIDGRLLNV